MEVYVEEINENEYMMIDGGVSLSATFINSLSSGIRIILEVGRSLGSAIRRSASKKLCKI